MQINRWFWGSSLQSGEVVDDVARELANEAQDTANLALSKVNSIVSSSLDYVTIPIAVDVNNALGTTGRWYLTGTGNTNAAYDTEHYLDSYTTENKKAGYQVAWLENSGDIKFRNYTSDVAINPATDSFTIAVEIGGTQVSSSSVAVNAYSSENMTAEIGNHEYFSGHVYAAGNKLLSGRVSFSDPNRPTITTAVLTVNGFNLITIRNGVVTVSPTVVTLGHSTVRAVSGSFDPNTNTINAEYSIEWTDYTGTDTVGEWISVTDKTDSYTFDVALTYEIPDEGIQRALILISAAGTNTVHVDWGDGTEGDQELGSIQLRHAYAAPGTYTARFTSISEGIVSFSVPTAGREVLTRVEWIKSTTLSGMNSSFLNAISLVHVGPVNVPRATLFSATFSGCTGIVSDVPRLWADNASIVTDHSDTFKGCTNANNYIDIPNSWKGL